MLYIQTKNTKTLSHVQLSLYNTFHMQTKEVAKNTFKLYELAHFFGGVVGTVLMGRGSLPNKFTVQDCKASQVVQDFFSS